MPRQDDMFGGGKSLADARAEFFRDLPTAEGAICQCCDRYGKYHAQRFGLSQARVLIFLYLRARHAFIHLPSHAPTHILKANTVGKLALWGLAVAEPNKDDPTKKRKGSWMILPKGVDFVEGKITIWSHAISYNDQLLGYKKEQKITLSDALQRPFDYRELMRTAARGDNGERFYEDRD